mmetsp:Transcript_24620/g.62545  ORF Transcript_24620/g.62545 Transcript_24620/m.62545 type:complete len:96 (-) Transcript_24620:350-637(-)
MSKRWAELRGPEVEGGQEAARFGKAAASIAPGHGRPRRGVPKWPDTQQRPCWRARAVPSTEKPKSTRRTSAQSSWEPQQLPWINLLKSQLRLQHP